MRHLHASDARVFLACLMVPLVSCLPTDTRPPPGSLLVTVTASQALLDGIPSSSTEDGWSVSYDRLLVAIGRASLNGEQCNNYSGFGYDRILDMKIPGPQKLSVLFALGQCDFSFSIENPDSESVLGAGVTEQDRTVMRTPASDRYTQGNGGGLGIFVRGSATRDGMTKTFQWSFRNRLYYRDCSDAAGGRGFALDEHASDTATIEIAAETLLQDNLEPSQAKLRFNAFADGDSMYGNDDGEITLEELGQVPLSDIQGANGYRDSLPASDAWKTFEDYVYLGLVPKTPRFQGQGTCSVMKGGDRDGPR